MKTDEELLAIARAAVPAHLKPLGRVVRRGGAASEAAASASARGNQRAPTADEIARLVATEVGAKLAPDDPDAADVEFVEHTPVGARSTVVQIRGGQVARVLKRA